MYLIIAEKPSLAVNIVNAIGNMKKNGNYYYNDKYVVVNTFGHLFTLADIEDYETDVSDYKWKMDNIPCFPREFKFNLKKDDTKHIDKGIESQFNLIKKLASSEKIDAIINAGDSDREGEIIIRLIIKHVDDKKRPVLRLWLPDQTDETILASLNDLKSDTEYDNLANEGFARTYIDWLYGVNLTRYATLKTGTLLRVGRVIIPIVKAIYDRDMEIRHFKSEIYYGLVSNEKTNGEEVELTSKLKFSKDKKEDALNKAKLYNENIATVFDKKEKEDILNPGKLYSLSKLQNYLGKKYKMSMDKSLFIVQTLYEKGYLTYPRTNTEYLSENEKDKVKKILSNIKELGYPVKFKDKKTIFDDKKIESHSALTPTFKIPKKENLTSDEYTVYQAVFKRFVAVFCAEDAKVLKTEIKIKLLDEEFILKGMVIKQAGWTKYDDSNKKDKFLPKLEVGDKVNINFQIKERETTPPKHYTIETLNNYLKNPFKEDKKNESESDDEDYKAIFEGLELGTEATRTGIINNAIKSKYIALNKDVYTILKDGEFLIETLNQMGISMDKYKTSQLGQALKKVYHEEIEIKDAILMAEEEIKSIFDNEKSNETIGLYNEVIGKCPKCGCDVIKTRYNYGCRDYKNCDFKININLCGKTITKEIAKELLENKTTNKICGFISNKTKKTFDSKLKLVDGKVEFDFN